jgi:mono/diheme cytochrome c family protein
MQHAVLRKSASSRRTRLTRLNGEAHSNAFASNGVPCILREREVHSEMRARAPNLANAGILVALLATTIALLSLTLRAQPRIAREQSQSSASPTFYRDVAPILQQHCEACHRSDGIAPMPLKTYPQAKQYAAAIAAAAKSKAMPPWFAVSGIGRFSNDPSLTLEQIATLDAWVAAGAPAGDVKDAPPALHWSESWTIPQPDLILPMTGGVEIPADGDVDYTYEIVPTHFTEDRWIQSVEVLPSLRPNVHHAVVYIRPPKSSWMRHAPVGVPFTGDDLSDPEDRRGAHWTDADVLLVYAPGSSPDEFPSTMAKFIPAGSDLIFQMHYTTNGHAGTDITRVGLRFAKTAPPKRVLTLQLTNDHFVIPPGAPDYRVEARGTLPNDALLLSLFPHMHLRGKRFEYNIVRSGLATSNVGGADYVMPGRPEGTPLQGDSGTVGLSANREGKPGPKENSVETLLRVNYHFHWQMSYKLAQPLFLKAGTELQAIAWYDNSKNNPHNPDPEAAVRWGDQTYDEMMVGFFDVAVDGNIDKQKFFQRSGKQSQPAQ